MGDEQNTDNPIVTPRENASLRVDGLRNLIDGEGNPISTEGRGKGNIALCRCGFSGSKPFCDGTHKKTDFRSARLADGELDVRDSYEAEGVTVHDNRGICAHIGYCTGELPEVFKMGEEPWIDPQGAPVERVAEQTRRCPSGALSQSIDGEEIRDQARVPAITITAAGPYFVTGGVGLQIDNDQWLEGASREQYALCRCGHSKNKPFCDGTHWYVKFDDPGLDTTAASEQSRPSRKRAQPTQSSSDDDEGE